MQISCSYVSARLVIKLLNALRSLGMACTQLLVLAAAVKITS